MLSRTKDIKTEIKELHSRIKFISESNNCLLKKYNSSSNFSHVKGTKVNNIIKEVEDNLRNRRRNEFLDEKEVSIVKNCFEKSVRFFKHTKKRNKVSEASPAILKSKRTSSSFANFQYSSNSFQEHMCKKRKGKLIQTAKEKGICTSCTSYAVTDLNITYNQSKTINAESKAPQNCQDEVEIVTILNNRNEGPKSILINKSNIVPVNKLSKAKFDIDSANFMEENVDFQNINKCHKENDLDGFIVTNSLTKKNTKCKHNSKIKEYSSVNVLKKHKKTQQDGSSVIPIINLTDPEVTFTISDSNKIINSTNNNSHARNFKINKFQKNFDYKEINNKQNITPPEFERIQYDDSDNNNVHINIETKSNSSNINNVEMKNNSIKKNRIDCTESDSIDCIDISSEDSYNPKETSGSFDIVTPVWDFKEEPVDFSVPRLHLDEKIRILSVQELNLLKSEGIKIKEGRWSKIEEDLLKRNYKNFTSQFEINNADLLLGIGRQFSSYKYENKQIKKFLKAKHFYVRLGKDINRRSLFDIYRKARILLNPRRLSSRSIATDFPLVQKLQRKYGNKWQLIGHKIGKCPKYVNYVYKYARKPPSQKGKWSDNEIQRLLHGIKDITGSVDLFHENLKRSIPWPKVAEFVRTRSERQCQIKWFSIINKKNI